MPITCIEHNHAISKGEMVYGVKIASNGACTSFCKDALFAIPLDERFTQELPYGISVHSAMTSEDWGTKVPVATLFIGSRIFSISRRAFRLYLPVLADTLLK